MSKWRAAFLNEIADIILSNVDKKINDDEKQVLLCNYLDVYQNRYLSRKHSFSNGSVNNQEWARFHLLENDVVITKDSEEADDIAIPSVILESIDKLVCGYHLAILRSKGELDGRFLMNLLQLDTVKRQFSNTANGITRYGLTINAIESVKLYFPISLFDQRKISGILSNVDEVIEKTEGAIAKYKAIKQGMMQDLFTRGLDKNGKLRPRFQDAPELYKKTELGWIPKDWEVSPIEQNITLITNGFVGTATPYYSTSDKGVIYLYGTNIRPDEITFDDIRFVAREFHQRQAKSQLAPGDMLTVQSGHIGTSAVIPDNFYEANCHALIITRFIRSKIFPKFVSYYLNSDIGSKSLEKIIIGSTVKHINTSELGKHLILKPSVGEQEKISKILDSIINIIKIEQTDLNKLLNIRKGLKFALLTG